MKDYFKINLHCLSDTEKLAKKIAKSIQPNVFIALKGKLGTGKTTLVRYIVNSLSKKTMKVTSPTFSLVNTYKLDKVKIWHYDLYRLKNKKEIFDLDFELALMDCIIVEWPELIEDFFPKKRIEITISENKNYLRIASVKIFGEEI